MAIRCSPEASRLRMEGGRFRRWYDLRLAPDQRADTIQLSILSESDCPPPYFRYLLKKTE